MSANWPVVRLGEVLLQVHRDEVVDSARTYRLLGVRWYGQGLFEKESKTGAGIEAARLNRVQTGDFVYNRLFAWKGSFAVASDEVNGCHVSNEFPCFVVDEARLHPLFLLWYFRQDKTWTLSLGHSVGATPTSRNRLKERAFLEFSLPLPSLLEQQRIVARIEEMAKKLNEMNCLRQQAVAERDRLLSCALLGGGSTPTCMGDLVQLRPPDVVVKPSESYQFAGVFSFGRGVFKGQARLGIEFCYPRLTRLRAGDFVYPKLMAWEGALGVVPDACNGCVVSTEFPVFAVDNGKVLPEVLDTYFRMPSVWPGLSGASTGTNVRRRRLNPRDFLGYKMPLPPMEAQVRFREVHHKLAQSKRLETEIGAEFDALLPAILDRAFKGEL